MWEDDTSDQGAQQRNLQQTFMQVPGGVGCQFPHTFHIVAAGAVCGRRMGNTVSEVQVAEDFCSQPQLTHGYPEVQIPTLVRTP